ncbi:hypothetical protein EST38_g6239 [Candolleomyces aberdarensis]|uniref:Mitochondrial import inner membrane translocase subunit TIM50 n=1 Tax=Candolleomyces aberdarensis TaxID=2316362 RepID=A0A4Q2DI24_9AGAR|nr:hypothetical protein EST38_g6239 [Candolleomyces aberdarensis]
MTRKFDYDYNYDPEGTSEVKQDPYADDYVADEHPNHEDRPLNNAPQPPKDWNRERSRTRSPTPPKQTEPSPEYLSISLQPSTPVTDSKSQRKLLILDLNGTLVLRSPHTRKNAYQLQGASRPLRAVHRRPYLLTFVDYLLDPRTREWLDTMVWSSAQPHSVDDMVNHSFEGRKGELVAIWARDTLGLNQAAYSACFLRSTVEGILTFSEDRKTQTTKDLAKPWKALSHLNHSAKSTLLLDDSPLKAHLQPWNHLCIKEYVSEIRKHDLKVKEGESVQELQDRLHEEDSSSTKRKRSEKKVKQLAERIAKATADAVGDDGKPLEYDQTLLAIVGVLDAVKHEDNIAGWMRSGGLVDVDGAYGRSRSETPGPSRKRGRPSDEVVPPPLPDSDALSSPPRPPPSSLPPPLSDVEQLEEETGIPLEDKSPPPHSLWFEHPDAFQYWVKRGRTALDELGIEVYHGISG